LLVQLSQAGALPLPCIGAAPPTVADTFLGYAGVPLRILVPLAAVCVLVRRAT